MSPENPTQPAAERPGDAVERRRLKSIRRQVDRIRMINRVHAALRSTLNVDDLHSIILTSIISSSALNFSRALLASYDEASRSFRGISALGARSRAEHERLQREVAEEEKSIADMMRHIDGLETTEEEQSLLRTSMDELTHHSFWITMYQKFGAATELLDQWRGIEIFCPRAQASGDGHSGVRFMDELLQRTGSRLVTRAELEASDLPPRLIAMFPRATVWSIIRTNRGPRLALIADRLHQREEPGELDLLHIDWFIGQVGLALENAEMVKDLEEAYNDIRALDQLKSNFLATISHELRTPLTAITGYVQLMLGNKIGQLSPGQREVLERILAHSDLLTGKVNDVIEIAELDSQQSRRVQLVPVDPLNVLMHTLPRLEHRRAHKNIAVDPEVTAPVPEILTTPVTLERIYFHLIDNAIKFGKVDGRVRVRFERDGKDLRISIADDGIGIAPSQIEPIFDLFYQVDSNLTRHYQGMGIGLAIVKKQLDQTGGRIQVSSQIGQGSTFTIIYPVA
ncbi:MAG: HAMP domain-containing sensor histidine kinase [Candidatus Sumerlaeia bacterium]